LTDLSTVLSQSTCVTDRQTDERTEFSSLDRVCIPCSAVKMKNMQKFCQNFDVLFYTDITSKTKINKF